MRTRPQFEWRRVLRWPSGDRVPSFPSGELQAREDCALAQALPFTRAQGVTVALERRRVHEWTEVERVAIAEEPG
jgi:hypothetical protein